VEADHPGWHVWRSRAGRWWAVRTGRDAQWKDAGGLPMTIDADDEDGLRAELAGTRAAADADGAA
jgi:hypothetical protein